MKKLSIIVLVVILLMMLLWLVIPLPLISSLMRICCVIYPIIALARFIFLLVKGKVARALTTYTPSMIFCIYQVVNIVKDLDANIVETFWGRSVGYVPLILILFFFGIYSSFAKKSK